MFHFLIWLCDFFYLFLSGMFAGDYLYDGEELKDSLGEEKKLSPYK